MNEIKEKRLIIGYLIFQLGIAAIFILASVIKGMEFFHEHRKAATVIHIWGMVVFAFTLSAIRKGAK